jgi:hypothetical protein
MELETVNELYLELSQFVTAKTAREIELEDVLTSARAIAQRQGAETAWERFDERIAKLGIGSVTPRVFKVLPSDSEFAPEQNELLVACQRILAVTGGSENWNGETHEALKLMEAAVTKATTP